MGALVLPSPARDPPNLTTTVSREQFTFFRACFQNDLKVVKEFVDGWKNVPTLKRGFWFDLYGRSCVHWAAAGCAVDVLHYLVGEKRVCVPRYHQAMAEMTASSGRLLGAATVLDEIRISQSLLASDSSMRDLPPLGGPTPSTGSLAAPSAAPGTPNNSGDKNRAGGDDVIHGDEAVTFDPYLSYVHPLLLGKVDREGWAPIHLAALADAEALGDGAIIGRLVDEWDADVEIVDAEKRLVGHLLALRNCVPGLQALLEVAPATAGARDASNRTLLHYASYFDARAVMEFLVTEAGVDPMGRDNHGRTALHYAMFKGNQKMADRLVSFCEELVDARDSDGASPMHYGAFAGKGGCVKKLLRLGGNLDVTDNMYRTPVHWAAARGHHTLLKRLVEANPPLDLMDSSGFTPLCWAIHACYPKCASILVGAGTDLGWIAPGTEGEMPVTMAHMRPGSVRPTVSVHNASGDATPASVVRTGRSLLYYASFASDNVSVVHLLLARGCRLMMTDEHGAHPIHVAAYSGSAGIVRVFLSAGVSVDLRDGFWSNGTTLGRLWSVGTPSSRGH